MYVCVFLNKQARLGGHLSCGYGVTFRLPVGIYCKQLWQFIIRASNSNYIDKVLVEL
jgi:hypothetical protein